MAISNNMRLRLYNGALRLCKQSKLASLNEGIEARRLLDDVWEDGAIDLCLQNGQWQFAARTIELSYSPSINSSFGFRYGFDKPTDLLRLIALCEDEFLDSPLLRYREDAGYWFADMETIYVRYVSKDDAFGYDESLWTVRFINYVKTHLAYNVAPLLSVSEQVLERVDKQMKEAKSMANSLDAQGQPTKFLPPGSWRNARMGNTRKYDRGTR